GAFQTTYQGGPYDFYVTKLNATGTALVYSTYLGGSGNDESGNISVDGAGNAYVAGATGSTNVPTTVGAFPTTYGGGFFDAFVTKLNATGMAPVYSTYLGGSCRDAGNALAADAAGNVYVISYTDSTDFPTTPGALYPTSQGGTEASVTKLTLTQLSV